MSTKDITTQDAEKYLKIVATEMAQDMVARMPEHKAMIEMINKNMPEIKRATSLHGKTQSQFMDNMLTLSHYTPLRNLHQILAQITKIKAAIDENNIRLLKKELRLKTLNRDLGLEQDPFKKELIEIKILEITGQLESAKLYLSGAVRILSNYTEQYELIKKAHNIKDEWNEEDFEAEEEKYHIMKAFEQGYCAAVSRGGAIDEGNLIYLTQIGINGAAAQREMNLHIEGEFGIMDKPGPNGEQREPSHNNLQLFLERMAEKYKGCSKNFATRKGMETYSKISSVKQGDMSLLKKKPSAHIEKMKKLYALSKSDNENEAKSAKNKLDRLLKKHQMRVEDLL